MAGKTKGLGRGLSALIPSLELQEQDIGGASEIDVDLIKPNENQPRKDFDTEKLQELSDSIKAHGVIQPILVRSDGDLYTIVAGERRYRAALLAGLTSIPVVVREVSDAQMTQLALVENIQRENLNVVEEARGISMLKEDFSLSQEEISKLLGKSRTAVANSLRLLTLPDEVLEMLILEELFAGHGRAILMADPSLQVPFAKYLYENDISVRAAEAMAKTFGDTTSLNEEDKQREKKESKVVQKHAHILHSEEVLSNVFGTKVNIKHSDKTSRGKVEIEYYDHDDLERIIDFCQKAVKGDLDEKD